MTTELFRTDAYAKSCAAVVVSADGCGIVLDQTVFYARGGGQPGDSGMLKLADGSEIAITDCFKDRDTGEHIHVPAEGAVLPQPGANLSAEIDWDRRHRMMRMHTALHLLCAVVEGGVTGGSIGPDKSRLDFDLPDTTHDKAHIEAALNRLVEGNLAVAISSVSEAELDANPDLVRTIRSSRHREPVASALLKSPAPICNPAAAPTSPPPGRSAGSGSARSKTRAPTTGA
jgi:misacylated tRNA(Ala) deacylase